MELCQSIKVRKDKFFGKLCDSLSRIESYTRGDTLFLYYGVSPMTRANECYMMCMRENAVITLAGNPLLRRYSNTDITG